MSDLSDRRSGPDDDLADDCFRRPVGADEPPSAAVVDAIAALRDRAADQLTPLYDSIDPDALDEVLASGAAAVVVFSYEEYTVRARPRAVSVSRGA